MIPLLILIQIKCFHNTTLGWLQFKDLCYKSSQNAHCFFPNNLFFPEWGFHFICINHSHWLLISLENVIKIYLSSKKKQTKNRCCNYVVAGLFTSGSSSGSSANVASSGLVSSSSDFFTSLLGLLSTSLSCWFPSGPDSSSSLTFSLEASLDSSASLSFELFSSSSF